MRAAPPTVSVVIPAHNAARFLRSTVRSVLDQTHPPELEIVCVDDGSTDDTRSLVRDHFPSVVYRYQSHRGVAAARNAGVRASRGEWVAFLDADDLWLPAKLAAQMAIVREDPRVDVVHTDCRVSVDGVLYDNPYPRRHQQGRLFDALLLQTGSVVCSTVLVKRASLEAVGGFDETLATAEDVHLFLRLAHRHRFRFVAEALVIKRDHGGNLTHFAHPQFCAGSIAALERIEAEFPEYRRGRSKTMRRALGRRARTKAEGLWRRGDYREAMPLFWQAIRWDRTPAMVASVVRSAVRSFDGR